MNISELRGVSIHACACVWHACACVRIHVRMCAQTAEQQSQSRNSKCKIEKRQTTSSLPKVSVRPAAAFASSRERFKKTTECQCQSERKQLVIELSHHSRLWAKEIIFFFFFLKKGLSKVNIIVERARRAPEGNLVLSWRNPWADSFLNRSLSLNKALIESVSLCANLWSKVGLCISRHLPTTDQLAPGNSLPGPATKVGKWSFSTLTIKLK